MIFALLSREADANLLTVTKSKHINPAALCCSAVTRSRRRHSRVEEKEKSKEPREPQIFTTKADFFHVQWGEEGYPD